MTWFHILLAISVATPEALVEQLRKQGATDIRVQHVQMDDDPSLEVLIRYRQADTGVHADVLDLGPSGWSRSGELNAWWGLTPADAERFLELKPAVSPPVTDLVVRTRSGGTEEEKITFDIYRMRRGLLVNVFSIPEYLSAMEHPSGNVATTSTQIELTPGHIVARITRQPGNVRTCLPYRWQEANFRFLPEAQSSAGLCP